jgi:hypothetical protein
MIWYMNYTSTKLLKGKALWTQWSIGQTQKARGELGSPLHFLREHGMPQ